MKLELGARFKRDFKRIQKRKLAEQQLWDVVGLLLAGQELPQKYKTAFVKRQLAWFYGMSYCP
jgi:mRNA-degrading endonuclease YafQ of YafQ-DinJ toxin-antitoxin module